MKNILTASTFLPVLFLSFGFTIKDRTDPISFDNKRLEVNFTRHLEFSDLVKVKLDLASYGISLDYMHLEFDENNGLEAIEFKVDCNDGFSGSAKNFKVTNDSQYGFFRDYNEKIESPFGTGALK